MPRLFRNLFSATLLLLVAASATAQGLPKYKERYQEYLVCNSGSCFEWHKGTFQLKWQSASVMGGLFDSINSNTIFRCQIGDFVLETPIGHDPNYQPGDTRATIHFIQPLLNQYRYMTLKLDWSKDQSLRVWLKGKLPDATSPMARTHAEIGPGHPIPDGEFQLRNSSTPFFSQTYDALFCYYKTKVKEQVVNGTTYELKKVKVDGANSLLDP